MSDRKLPGEKVTKLYFTVDDLPLLKQWYEDGNKRDGLTNAPPFEQLPIETKNNMAKTLSFSGYKLDNAWEGLGTCIIHDLKTVTTTIKNFFRWKKNIKTN